MKKIFLLLLLSGCSHHIQETCPDKITLKSGQVISCVIYKQDSTEVLYFMKGAVRSVKTNDIVSVEDN
jgi:hypothetical protein